MNAVLFDLDGTLLDSSEGVLDSFYSVVDKLKLPYIPRTEVKKKIGSPVQSWFKDFFQFDDNKAQYAADLFREDTLVNGSKKATVYSGVYDLLKILKKRKIKVAVATNKREDCAMALLNNFEIAEYCDIVHGADARGKLKKSDIVELCIRDLGIERERVVLVGDTVHDAEGAYSAGINFIGVTYGIGFKCKAEREKFPSIGMVDEIIDIMNLL